MKIASITCIFENEFFVKPHFKMISELDEMIVLVGKKPFIEYFEAGLVNDKPDNSEKIIRELYPRAHIIHHEFDFFCGDLLNLGVEKAKELGCDVIIKLDVDMFLTQKDWKYLLKRIKEEEWEELKLDYGNNTIVYKGDFEHGVPCNIFPVGADTLLLKTHRRFNQNDRQITTNAEKVGLISKNWDMVIHHFTQFKRNDFITEQQRVESLSGFPGWQKAPDEIINMFI